MLIFNYSFKEKAPIIICAIIVFSYAFLLKASSSAKIQFTADTILSLSGVTNGDLYVAQNSEADSLAISGTTLTVGDIPTGSNFILKTPEHANALKITPTGGVLDLNFESSKLSSGNITQWTLSATSGTAVAHIVGVPLSDTWYSIKIDGVLLSSYQSSASSEVSFSYDGSFSTKVFTIEEGGAPAPTPTLVNGGGGLPPGAYIPPDIPPGGFTILINDGAENTNDRTVNLKFNAGFSVKKMAISESIDFIDAVQEDYFSEKKWTFSEKEGVKIIYAKFYTQYGVSSETISNSIIYQKDPYGEKTKDLLVQVSGDDKVYLIKNGKKQWIKTSEEFIFQGFKWSDIILITAGQLLAYPDYYDDSVDSLKNDTVAYVFLRNLKLGDKGTDVKDLQRYLNKNGFIIAIKGAGSVGKETELFGPATRKAVIKFQDSHKQEILIPVGLKKGTGVFGDSTRKYINAVK